MKNNLRFIYLLFKMKLQRQMMYRLAFFGATFVDGSMFILWLFMFKTIYAQVDYIGSWSQGESMIFLGTFSLLNAINMTIYFFGVISIPSKIRTGELDHYLTKPVNALLRITFENINIGSSPLILLSIGIIIYGLSLTGYPVSTHTGILYVCYVLLMALLYYDMGLLVRIFAFFFISANGIQRVEEQHLIYVCVFRVLFLRVYLSSYFILFSHMVLWQQFQPKY